MDKSDLIYVKWGTCRACGNDDVKVYRRKIKEPNQLHLVLEEPKCLKCLGIRPVEI